jgi:hypothetical protein
MLYSENIIKMNKVSRTIFTDPVFLLMALFSILFHLISATNLEYHRDEMLYFALGQHPSFGYNSVPPLIGWCAWLMESIFGYSLFAVRLLPSLLSGAMILMVASMAKEMGGSRYASFLASLGLMVSIFFMRSFFLFMPVFLEIFLWTLILLIVIKYLNTNSDNYLYLLGIAAGFALLNKYLAALLLTGLFVIIPFTSHRAVFRKRAFWIAMGISALIFLPNLIWQAWRGFPAFGHLGELYDTQLVHMDIPLFLFEQLMMPVAGTVLTVAGLIYLLRGKRIGKFKFLGFVALFVIIMLMILKGKSYYTLGVFPLLLAAGALSYDKMVSKRWIRISLPVMLVILTIPIIPMGIPVFDKEGMIKYFSDLDKKYGIELGRRFEDGTIHSLPQDYADMIGWEEMTALAAKAYSMVENKETCYIYGENYGQASAVTIIGKKYNLPEALSFSESFKYWLPEQFDPDLTSLVYISEEEPGEDVKGLFRKITLIGSVSDPHAREFGTTVYLCVDPTGSFNHFWEARLKRFYSTGD